MSADLSNLAGMFVGVIPADAVPVQALYASLLPFEWQGVGIPYSRMRMTLRQDLVIHKFVDRDGAHVEGTGRAPLQFEATCPFHNTLGKGLSDSWSQPLYPTQWRKLIVACAQGASGVLQHPELGAITCKVESCVTEWSGGERAGPTVNIVWVETDDSQAAFQIVQASPISAGAAACGNLDSYLGDISPAVVPTLPTFPSSFSDLFRQIQGIGTQLSLLSYSLGGQINAVIYQANTLEQDLAANPNALNWPIFQAAEQAKDACYTLQGNLLTTGAKVSLYTVQKESTIPEIATAIPTDLVLFLNLNPTIALNPVVQAGTQVRYYKQAA